MSVQNTPPANSAASLSATAMSEVDKYGVPLEAFGDGMPPEFFEVIGRLLAVNGKIEYLHDRLGHLPTSEKSGVRKVEQFLKRYGAGRMDRNAVVHSFWTFGVHEDPEVIVGFRYKVTKSISGETATVTIRDVPKSEKEQAFVQYTLEELRKLLRHDVTTMQLGQLAYSQVSLNWAHRQEIADEKDSSSP